MTGALVAHYRIDTRLGGGPLGDVYLAWDMKAECRVALRILASEITADRDRLLRFMDQVRAAAIVRHPNIAGILDGGHSDGTHYVAMEYVEGEPLKGPLPAGECEGVLTQLCSALQAAHSIRVAHRGVRPSNLLRTPDGQVKLLDYGVLKGGLGRHDKTVDKIPAHGVPYLSPEQVCDRRREIGRRSDIFSLGAVMYELLTGELPFRGSTSAATMDAILDQEPKAPSEIRTDIPLHLSHIVLKCLEKDRNLRYQSVQELLHDLQGSGNDAPVVRPRRRRRRRLRIPVIPILVVLAAVAGLAYFVSWYWGERLPDSMAIAPFVCTGEADPAMCRGFSSHLMRQFSGMRTLRVTAAAGPAGESKDQPPAVVLTGSISRSREDLIVDAKLTSTADGSVLFTQRYLRRTRDLMAVVYAVAGAAADKLKRISDSEREWFARQPTAAPDAFLAYARGSAFLENGNAADAIQYLKSATASDPRFALALARLAEAYCTEARLEAGPPSEFLPAALEAASRAVEIDPALPEGWSAFGEVRHLELRLNEAEECFRKAVTLRPLYPLSFIRHAELLTARGGGEENIAEMNRGRAAAPASFPVIFGSGMVFALTHQFDQAITEFRLGGTLADRDRAAAVWIAAAEAAKGATRQAQATIDTVPDREDDPIPVRSLRAWVLARASRRTETEKILAALERTAGHRYVSAFRFAEVYSGLGEKPKALDYLEKALDQNAVDIAYLPKWPPFDELQMERRFQEVLRRAGFGPTAQVAKPGER